jgi:FkbM family methyltransferase
MWRVLLAEGNWTYIIDIGANYGEMLVGADLPPSATIIAVEPNPYIVPHLERTIREYGCRVDVIAKAVSAQSGTADLIVDRTYSGLSCIAGLQSKSENHVVEIFKVPATTLTEIVETRDSDKPIRALVKIDVEGHEYQILRGARKLIECAEVFVALVEILHATDDEIDWLLGHFAIELYDIEAADLVRVDAATATELRDMIVTRKLYPQDVVLRRIM